MSAHMKKHLTNEDVKILVFGQEIKLKKSLKASLVNIINEVVDLDSYSSEEVHGKWLYSPRMRVAKYLKGARKREGLTQKEVCDKLDIQKSNFSSMERGERPIPEYLICGLAKLLNVKSKMLDEEQVEKKLKAS